MRSTGTQARGIRTPIIREGDDLVSIVAESVLEAARNEKFDLHDKDVVAVTEAVVARAQGNYATVTQIAEDVSAKFPNGEIGVVFPIFSRNRFSVLLKGIAMGAKKVWVMFSYPADEVGNHIITLDQIDEKGVNPYSDSFDEKGFRDIFGHDTKHQFTGADYIEFYKSLGDNIEIIFSNQARDILKYTPYVINADIHSRKRTKRILEAAGASKVVSLDEIMSSPVSGSGYNPQYGLLGSNMAGDELVKLFPRDSEKFALDLQKKLKEATGINFETMVYGDGAFKDPQGGIWELADPVVSPGFTQGLAGTPNEIKLKYLADNQFAHLRGEELQKALIDSIKAKDLDLMGKMASQGTTPRRIVELIGSLSDLISGSGDKGTPVVLVQGYFDNYAT